MQLLPSEISLKINHSLIAYPEAVAFMEQHVALMLQGKAENLLWFLQHPALYSGGSSAKSHDLRDHKRFPVYQSNRGGQYTYHGPGQRIIYLMINLNAHQDIRAFITALEDWVMMALADFGIQGEILDGKVGIWVKRNKKKSKDNFGYDKISAIGIRLRKWISFHGLSVNINPNLEHFEGIVPCGIQDAHYGITSLAHQGVKTTFAAFDQALIKHFPSIFNSQITSQKDCEAIFDKADNFPNQTDKKSPL